MALFSRRAAQRVLVAACAGLVPLTVVANPGTAAAAQAPLPVPYSGVAAIAADLPDPLVSPPGANDWSCKPTAEHPDPIVLVHGLLATASANWNTVSPLLKNNGYCVYALTYGADPRLPIVGGVLPMAESAQQLADFVDRVQASTGAAKVDLVGHSEGTVMPQYYLKRLGGAAHVNRYVALTPLYDGSTVYGLDNLVRSLKAAYPALTGPISDAVDSYCGSCQSFLTGSPFLTDLYADGVYAVPGVQYTTILTKYDELVTPYTSGLLDAPNATDIVVQDQCATDYAEHLSLVFDPVAGQDILNALDPQHPRPVPCTTVYPILGAPASGTPGGTGGTTSG